MENSREVQLVRNMLIETIKKQPITFHEEALGVDWVKLLEVLKQHKLLSFYFGTIKKHIPAEYLTMYLAEYYSICKMNMVRNRELAEVAKLFVEERIPYVLVKGVALSRLLYDDDSLRQCSDIDLLVKEPDLHKAFHVLKKVGYIQDLEMSPNADEAELLDEPVNKFFEDVHEIQCVKRISENVRVSLEIKRCSSAFWDSDNSVFFDHVSTIRVNDMDVVTSDLLFSFLHLCGNFYENFETPAAIIGGGSLRDMLDVFLFWDKYHNQLDWQTLRDVSDEMKAYHKIKYTLSCLNEIAKSDSVQEKIDLFPLAMRKVQIECYENGATYHWRSSFLDRVLNTEGRIKEYILCQKELAYRATADEDTVISNGGKLSEVPFEDAIYSFDLEKDWLTISLKLPQSLDLSREGQRYQVQFIDNDVHKTVENHSVSFSWLDGQVMATYGDGPENWWQDPRKQEQLHLEQIKEGTQVIYSTRIPVSRVYCTNSTFGNYLWCCFMRLKELADGSFNIQNSLFGLRDPHYLKL